MVLALEGSQNRPKIGSKICLEKSMEKCPRSLKTIKYEPTYVLEVRQVQQGIAAHPYQTVGRGGCIGEEGDLGVENLIQIFQNSKIGLGIIGHAASTLRHTRSSPELALMSCQPHESAKSESPQHRSWHPRASSHGPRPAGLF